MQNYREAYKLLAEQVAARGGDMEAIKDALKNQRIETPSWGYGNSGTRFGVFAQAGVPRNPFEKFEDAAIVNQVTGICPSVAIHIPWDKVPDYKALQAHAEQLGLQIGAINPNVFQDQDYKLGSVCNPNPAIRRKATDHLLECVEIGKQVGSTILSLWFADGTNYAGQDHIRERRHRMFDALQETYRAMPSNMRMLIEYKFYEPAFYHTDLNDWGAALTMAQKLGPQAQVLVDLGHHAQGTNVEHIVALLLDEGRLGGFHFNNRKYGDDDLIVGSVNPYELFLIYYEIVEAEKERIGTAAETARNIAYMIDQAHNIEAKIPAMIQSVMNCQVALARALLVNRAALRGFMDAGDVLGGHRVLNDAFETDVRPLLGVVREEMGLQPDPMQAYYDSGHAQKILDERKEGVGAGWG